MDVKRIYLVGFMGAGKSSVGRALSRRLGWRLIDLDAEIERSEKLTVQEIFQRLGEPRFRQLERQHLENAAGRQNVVIALGGGAYVNAENRALIDSTGISVWLKVEFPNILKRVKIDGTRPLFGDNDRAERLYQERLPSYSQAGLHVITDDRSSDAVAVEIAELVARMEHDSQ